VIRPSIVKHRVDLDATSQNRQVFSQQSAREAAELPAALRRRRQLAAERRESFREMLEAGRGAR
jgi:hypothetical protein